MNTDSPPSPPRDAPAAAPGHGERDVLASRLAYLTVGLPTVGTVGAVAYAVYDGLWLSDVVLFAVMYVITALGIEAGMHRYFTHRSFEACEPVKVLLGVAGSMAAQGPIVLLGRQSSTAPRVRRYRSRPTFTTAAGPRSVWAARRACGTAMPAGCSV